MSRKEMEERVGSNFWKPVKEEEFVEGVLLECRDGQYGVVYDIQQENKKIITVPSSAILLNRIKKIDEGKEIKITFQGLQAPKLKGQNPMRLYKVEVEK